MPVMQVLASYLAVATLIVPSLAAAVSHINKRDVGLKVELSQTHNTEISAVLINTGSEALKLLHYGTLLDENPVQKLNVFKDGVEVAFTGINVRYKMYDLSEDAFSDLAPGQALTSIIDIAALHDLRSGDYTVSTAGVIPYAAPNTTETSGSVAYDSNVLHFSLSDDEIGMVPRAVSVIEKRIFLTGCSGSEEQEQRKALGQLVTVAALAAQAARSGTCPKFQEFFKTTDPGASENVAARYDAVAREARITTTRATTYTCEDQLNFCSPNALTYFVLSQNLIAICPLFYSLSSLSRVCGDQDQTTTALHEITHSSAVFSPGTQDYAFGLAASMQLSSAEALLNADTYALYANAVVNNCV